MANILMAFHNGVVDENNPNALPIFYESFIDGLDKAGNVVYIFSHQFFGLDFGAINDESKAYIQSLNLDICFLFNNCFYDLSEIVDCPIVIYEVDSPAYFSNKNILRQKTDRFLYFAVQTDSVKKIQDEFGVSKERIFYVPFFSEVYADNSMQKTNISFIGSKMLVNQYMMLNTFLQSNPSKEERILYQKCIEEIRNRPGITMDDLVQKLNLRSNSIIKYINIPETLMFLSDEKRIHILSSIVDLGLELYGTNNWGNDYYHDFRLNLAYNSRRVYTLKHNQEILNTSKIGINVSHLQATSGFPWRVMDIMASNACLVTDYHTDFDTLFKGIDLPIYTSKYEARDLCQKLLCDDSRRSEIVEQCQEVINEKYRFKYLLSKIEQYTGVTMHKTEMEEKESVYFRHYWKHILIKQITEIDMRYFNHNVSEKKLYKELQRKFNGKVVIPFADFSISTACSLKCKNCSQWMPYLKTKKIVPAAEIKNQLKEIFKYVDYIHIISPLGGEAFLNPDFDIILNELLEYKRIGKIGYIRIVTNGTIYPDEKIREILCRPDILVLISNYHENVKAQSECKKLIDFLQQNQCNYYFPESMEWVDLGIPGNKQNLNPKEMKVSFETCFARDCVGIYEGRLYHCPRSYALENMGKLIPLEKECISFPDITGREELAKRLQDFYSLEYLSACAYCKTPENRKIVVAAEQI